MVSREPRFLRRVTGQPAYLFFDWGVAAGLGAGFVGVSGGGR